MSDYAKTRTHSYVKYSLTEKEQETFIRFISGSKINSSEQYLDNVMMVLVDPNYQSAVLCGDAELDQWELKQGDDIWTIAKLYEYPIITLENIEEDCNIGGFILLREHHPHIIDSVLAIITMMRL